MIILKRYPALMKLAYMGFSAFFFLLAVCSTASAGRILYYDSVSGGTSNALDRLDSQTDASLISSSSATTTLGSNVVFTTTTSATTVQGLGDGGDKLFRFGSNAGGSGTMSGPLTIAHMANGPYIEVSFTAAQDMILNKLSFKLYNNSNNGSNYGARDAGLFVKVSSSDYSQFGDLFTSPTKNGIQGTVSFTDTREVSKGDLVTLRIAFTDRTRTNNDNQAATRIGAIDISADSGSISDRLRILTYNIHGGKGPNGEGTPTYNLTTFRNTLMQNEDIICLQEVDNGDCWAAVQAVFSDYPHRYRTINQETDYWFWETPKQTSIAILSKYPFESTHNKLVNTDPTIDKWQRHGQHIQIKTGGEIVHIFHYHNTYDPNDGGSSSEVAGMEKFRNYVIERLGPNALTQEGRVLAVGDFNINGSLLDGIMPNLLQKQSNWVDHVTGMSHFTNSGVYTSGNLSDHNGVWASIDLAAPVPNPLTWSSAPAESGTTSITMTATSATDANGVEYYFTNTSISDGSHDSGWQSSPHYVDSGISLATNYSYTVQTRDKSANSNASDVSGSISPYTDDGDNLPNSWEHQYFTNLTSTAGSASEDWDNDGRSDFDEWVAGTDPSDATSNFRLWLETDNTGSMTLKWTAVEGKTYAVYSCDDLASDWDEVASGITTANTVGSYPIGSASGDRFFYKVEVSQ